MDCAFGVVCEKSLPNLKGVEFLLCFWNFMDYILHFRSLICLVLIFVYGIKHRLTLFFFFGLRMSIIPVPLLNMFGIIVVRSLSHV